jgi:hypothetical protein
MSRWRKLYPKMWSDEKVSRLSRPPPNGQSLWVHLLAGEQTGPIPGLFKIGEAAFAESLGWALEGFREAFREVFRAGLAKADWKARLVWVPNGIKYNPPQSPNVVTSWADSWEELPHCSLKIEAWSHLKAFIEALSEGHREAFGKALAKPMPIQEQEQEQEQEERSFALSRETLPAAPSAVAGSGRKRKVRPEAEEESVRVNRYFRAMYRQRYGQDPKPWAKKENSQLKHFVVDNGEEFATAVITQFFASADPHYLRFGHPLNLLISQAPKLWAERNNPNHARLAGAVRVQTKRPTPRPRTSSSARPCSNDSNASSPKRTPSKRQQNRNG